MGHHLISRGGGDLEGFFRGQIIYWNLILVQNSMIEFMIIGNFTQRKNSLIFSQLNFWTKMLPK